MTTTSAQRDENRLTADDVARIQTCMAEVAADWKRQTRKGGGLPGAALETLVRIGLGAIGCGPFDMRDSEIRAVTDMAADLLIRPAP